MFGIKVYVKIADSAAKYYDCRIKFDEKNQIIYYIGPDECKDFIIDEINKFMKHINLPELNYVDIEFLHE